MSFINAHEESDLYKIHECDLNNYNIYLDCGTDTVLVLQSPGFDCSNGKTIIISLRWVRSSCTIL